MTRWSSSKRTSYFCPITIVRGYGRRRDFRKDVGFNTGAKPRRRGEIDVSFGGERRLIPGGGGTGPSVVVDFLRRGF